MRPLRIGVNALYLIPGGVGGTEIYLRNLLRALAEIDSTNVYVLFTNCETGRDLAPGQGNFHVARQAVRASFRPARILWEQTVLPLAIAAQHVDVLINPGFTAPILCGCPQVTVFHDLQHKRHPEHFRWLDLLFWRFLLFWSAHVSPVLIADSEATRADLLRFYRLPDDKVRVIPLGVDPKFFEIARARRPEPMLLSVSTLHPHKNLDRLLRAFAGFRRARPEFRLVIAGLRGFDTANLERLRQSLELNDYVEFTGWIAREDLYDLYARAFAFLYPSTFEGFGLPVLEALAAGVPTACSNIEPLSSTAGDAALQFDPQDEKALLDAMTRLVCDGGLRAQLATAGPQRANQFSWKTTARLTLDAMVETGSRSLTQ
ncbi:MAG TPA: glycosyltransferase family 1 protein [Bryobacteraceae bacterium]|nr:glycosyltransferase family 1 protein [Bryobacteraceae bacterium]